MRQDISGERAWRRVRRVTVGAVPAAGADATLTVPSGKLWEVIAVAAQLTTAVAVAARIPRLQVTIDGGLAVDIIPIASQAASLVGRFQWKVGDIAYALAPNQLLAIPELVIPPGGIINTLTDAIQAADQWTGLTVYCVETTYQRGTLELPSWLADLVDVYTGSPG